VIQVFTLEQQANTELRSEVVALRDDRGSTDVVPQEIVQLRAEERIGPRVLEGRLEFHARRNQRLGNESSAEFTEASVCGGVLEHDLRVSVRPNWGAVEQAI
jgi:hypothetical protein